MRVSEEVRSTLVFGFGADTFIQLRLETMTRGGQDPKTGGRAREEDKEQMWPEFMSVS